MNTAMLEMVIRQAKRIYGIEELEIPTFDDPTIVPFVPQESRHFFLDIPSSLVQVQPLRLQAEITVKDDVIRLLWFISPPIVTAETVNEVILFGNEINRQLYRGKALGRFWVDVERLDIAFELCAPGSIFGDDCALMARQLFGTPIGHFRDVHIPLMQVAEGSWPASTAVRYLRELRDQGVVDNCNYGLT